MRLVRTLWMLIRDRRHYYGGYVVSPGKKDGPHLNPEDQRPIYEGEG